ncbi:MAG: polysaccharide biosynthesis/export family protein [Pseudomonadota bacterium]
MRSDVVRWAAFVVLVLMAGCASGPEAAGPLTTLEARTKDKAREAAEAEPQAAFQSDFRLDTGDKLRVIVFGEPDLTGAFAVGDTGEVALPLIGAVAARGLSLRELETRIAERYADGFLNAPRVAVEVTSYRPFYILGEVENGGAYPYSAGLTVMTAVAKAGGYTYRANRRRAVITRADGRIEKVTVGPETIVFPGDVVRVPERFF